MKLSKSVEEEGANQKRLISRILQLGLVSTTATSSVPINTENRTRTERRWEGKK